jgi:hypothetical protein
MRTKSERRLRASEDKSAKEGGKAEEAERWRNGGKNEKLNPSAARKSRLNGEGGSESEI